MVEKISREVFNVLHNLAGEWSDIVDEKELSLTPMDGAMTSLVYECHWPRQNQSPRKVIVRFYGDNANALVKREDEILIFERMAESRQGPHLLGRFSKGRVEEFLHARTLRAPDLRNPDISLRIAEKLADFHAVEMPWPSQPVIWERLRCWLNKALEHASHQVRESFQLLKLGAEISSLEQKLSWPEQRIAFCHNDLQYGNVMLDERTGSLTLIDYEYASYNPVAFDIGNHFCEMAADYHSATPHLLDFSKYPGFDERYRFVEAYLKASRNFSSRGEIEGLMQEAETFTLASHLHWGLWGVISAGLSEIKFDYLSYAKQRFQEYYHSKNALLARDVPYK